MTNKFAFAACAILGSWLCLHAAAETPAKISREDIQPRRVWNTIVCTDLAYGPRLVGAGAAKADVAQIYDLYLPAPVGEIKPDAPFFLFVHGGAWSSGNKGHGALLMAGFAAKGFVCASMNYALCSPSAGGDCTFARMLEDIDLMVAQVPALYKALGLEPPKKIAIGGSSAGGHLVLTYAYDGANPDALKLKLRHAVPVGCVYSDCGPSDLTSPEFATTSLAAMKGNLVHWRGQFNVLAGGKRNDGDMEGSLARIGAYSPVALVTTNAPPTVCIYGEIRKVPTSETFAWDAGKRMPFTELWKWSKGTAPEKVGTDGIVATQNYHALTNRLAACKVPYAAKLTRAAHCSALFRDKKLGGWLYETVRDYLKK